MAATGQAMANAPLVDLSGLTEEEKSKILAVLQRDDAFRKDVQVKIK